VGKPVMIVARTWRGRPWTPLVVNKAPGTRHMPAVQGDGLAFGAIGARPCMEDHRALTVARPSPRTWAISWRTFTLEDLGKGKEGVLGTRTNTTIIDGARQERRRSRAHSRQLRALRSKRHSAYDKREAAGAARERGRAASHIIKVAGGPRRHEKEKKARVEGRTQRDPAAVGRRDVPGGGVP